MITSRLLPSTSTAEYHKEYLCRSIRQNDRAATIAEDEGIRRLLDDRVEQIQALEFSISCTF
jgi:hypothetical protein